MVSIKALLNLLVLLTLAQLYAYFTLFRIHLLLLLIAAIVIGKSWAKKNFNYCQFKTRIKESIVYFKVSWSVAFWHFEPTSSSCRISSRD